MSLKGVSFNDIVCWIEDIPNYFALRHTADATVKHALEEAGVRLASPNARR
jgi:hypothetical protein